MNIETAKEHMDSEINNVRFEGKEKINSAANNIAIITASSMMVATETSLATGNYTNVLIAALFVAASSANCIKVVNKLYKTIDYLKEIRHYLEQGINPFENVKEEEFKEMIKHFEESKNKKHQ